MVYKNKITKLYIQDDFFVLFILKAVPYYIVAPLNSRFCFTRGSAVTWWILDWLCHKERISQSLYCVLTSREYMAHSVLCIVKCTQFRLYFMKNLLKLCSLCFVNYQTPLLGHNTFLLSDLGNIKLCKFNDQKMHQLYRSLFMHHTANCTRDFLESPRKVCQHKICLNFWSKTK